MSLANQAVSTQSQKTRKAKKTREVGGSLKRKRLVSLGMAKRGPMGFMARNPLGVVVVICEVPMQRFDLYRIFLHSASLVFSLGGSFEFAEQKGLHVDRFAVDFETLDDERGGFFEVLEGVAKHTGLSDFGVEGDGVGGVEDFGHLFGGTPAGFAVVIADGALEGSGLGGLFEGHGGSFVRADLEEHHAAGDGDGGVRPVGQAEGDASGTAERKDATDVEVDLLAFAVLCIGRDVVAKAGRAGLEQERHRATKQKQADVAEGCGRFGMRVFWGHDVGLLSRKEGGNEALGGVLFCVVWFTKVVRQRACSHRCSIGPQDGRLGEIRVVGHSCRCHFRF